MIIKSDISELTDLEKGKQEIIKIYTSLKALPFKLPTGKITLYSRNKKEEFPFILPCTINKYPLFSSISADRLNNYHDKGQYRTYSFKINKKL